jgi:hypothetical protein
MGWTKTSHQKEDGEGIDQTVEYWHPELKGKHPHFLQYSPKRMELKVETSLPKVLSGSNVGLLSETDLNKVLDLVSDRVSSWCGSDVPHVSEWDIRGRVDSVYAWNVGSCVDDYLHALKSVNLSRHVSQSVDRESTLYWRNSQRVIRMYDKFRETRVDEAKGVLRFEVQLNHAKAEFERMANVKSSKVKDILKWENSRRILENYLEGIGGDLVIADEEKCLKLLTSKFGATKAIRLFGYIQSMRVYSRDELVRFGVRRETVWRALRDVHLAGANVGVAKSGVLPSLTLPKTYDGEIGAVG